MEYEGVFNSDNIVDSRFISEGAPNSLFKVDENSIIISTQTLEREFKQIPTLNQITVNIKVDDYLVVKHNADKKSKNIYTWNITKDNYQNKSIQLEISKLSIANYTGSQVANAFNKLQNKETVILVIVVVFLIGFLYFFIKRKRKDKNIF